VAEVCWSLIKGATGVHSLYRYVSEGHFRRGKLGSMIGGGYWRSKRACDLTKIYYVKGG
jgi:hypothetical protein